MLVLLAYNVLLSNTLLFNYNARYSIGVEAQQQRRKRNGNNGGGQRRRNQQQQNPYGQYGGFGDQFNQQQYANQFNQQQQNAGDPSEYYKALQLKPNASAKDIKSAYRKLALKYHVSSYNIWMVEITTLNMSFALVYTTGGNLMFASYLKLIHVRIIFPSLYLFHHTNTA